MLPPLGVRKYQTVDCLCHCFDGDGQLVSVGNSLLSILTRREFVRRTHGAHYQQRACADDDGDHHWQAYCTPSGARIAVEEPLMNMGEYTITKIERDTYSQAHEPVY